MIEFLDFLKAQNPIVQALAGTTVTWGVTAIGAALVYVRKNVNRKFLDTMLGFAAGVMIAASYWSLLKPAIEMSADLSVPTWLPAASGFLLGAVFLRVMDRFLPHLHLGFKMEEAEGIKTSLHATTLLVLAVTLHNIPEGLAVGVAFGAVGAHISSATFAGAVALTIGIALQNFPEGLAISMPLRRLGFSRWKSFFYGQLSATVEIAGGLIGAAAITLSKPILPYALAFAAGAMIYVVIEEVIPESQREGNSDIATLGAMTGFVIMMILDVGLG